MGGFVFGVRVRILGIGGLGCLFLLVFGLSMGLLLIYDALLAGISSEFSLFFYHFLANYHFPCPQILTLTLLSDA